MCDASTFNEPPQRASWWRPYRASLTSLRAVAAVAHHFGGSAMKVFYGLSLLLWLVGILILLFGNKELRQFVFLIWAVPAGVGAAESLVKLVHHEPI